MKIGIMGGTFNPPHIAHIRAMEIAYEKLALDKIIAVPTGKPPHKEIKKGMPSPIERLNMVTLATEDLNFVEVCDIEIFRTDISYTVDTLSALSEKYQKAQFYFIMGTDMFLSFGKWHKPHDIIKMTSLVVIPRDESDFSLIENAKKEYEIKYAASVHLLKTPALIMSSTMIREEKRLYDMVPNKVLEYINKNNLYK